MIPESFEGDYMMETRWLLDGELMNGYQYYATVMRYDDDHE